MAQAPVPEGLSSTPDHRERSAPHGATNDMSAHLTETGSVAPGQEQPTSSAGLCVSLLPAPTGGFDRVAMIGAARPFAGLVLMGVLAPAVTICAAKAAKCPPALTAAVVGLELALAYLASRATNGTGSPLRRDLRGLPA
jgi:hypothetical protein